MSGDLRGRLTRLEAGARGPCGECGHVNDVVEYDVVWADDTDAVGEGPEFCPACGRRLVYEVTWMDAGGRGGS